MGCSGSDFDSGLDSDFDSGLCYAACAVAPNSESGEPDSG
jgi:hypothetical protein